MQNIHTANKYAYKKIVVIQFFSAVYICCIYMSEIFNIFSRLDTTQYDMIWQDSMKCKIGR